MAALLSTRTASAQPLAPGEAKEHTYTLPSPTTEVVYLAVSGYDFHRLLTLCHNENRRRQTRKDYYHRQHPDAKLTTPHAKPMVFAITGYTDLAGRKVPSDIVHTI